MTKIKADRVRVAVVDDNVAVLDSVKLALELHGWEIHVAVGGESYMMDVARKRPDCVVLEPNLRYGMTGAELASEIDRAGVPIIGLTAEPESAMARQVHSLGAASVLTKPIGVSDLIDEIEMVLGGDQKPAK